MKTLFKKIAGMAPVLCSIMAYALVASKHLDTFIKAARGTGGKC